VLDPIHQHSPVVIINGLTGILFMIGSVLFGIAMIRTVTLPRWYGILWPWALQPIYWVSGYPSWFPTPPGLSRSWAVWVSVPASRGAASAMAHAGRFGSAHFREVETNMSAGSSQNPRQAVRHSARVRVIIFRVVATFADLFFVVAVVLMASAPWVLLQPDQQTRTELNRWFLTVAGSLHAIAAGVLFARTG
jgi:hypothetical protein